MTSRDKSHQSKKFIDAARELGADDDPAAFKERLKALVKAPAQSRQVRKPTDHDSDCSVHNGPALDTDPCDKKPRKNK